MIPADGSVTSIGQNAFQGSTDLTSIAIPSSITSIDFGAFYFCRSLTRITYQGTVAEWQAISKGDGWDMHTPAYTVFCTDGTITKDGTVTMN